MLYDGWLPLLRNVETMKRLNHGEIPPDLEIDEPYDMWLTAADDELVCGIINQGIDAHLEAVCADDHGLESKDGGNKHHISITDSKSMRCFLRRLMENGSENATDLASCIMETLGIEWI
ncbi:hypothetical protein LCGC14_1377900 [marine sediment metagenome]|uniref:Uncharacterized protein n=1 Tax=marine sediment metagenome TaxID=412755 RepID=A0A0F9KPF6_9ZZZZ